MGSQLFVSEIQTPLLNELKVDVLKLSEKLDKVLYDVASLRRDIKLHKGRICSECANQRLGISVPRCRDCVNGGRRMWEIVFRPSEWSEDVGIVFGPFISRGRSGRISVRAKVATCGGRRGERDDGGFDRFERRRRSIAGERGKGAS
ncbi:Uncharacterized protein Fot_14247 [Forsythia ovata]|uniref:Uncharacterized protein n=1 Tax=Forsythia ovata TaxID=205694 RepID=A0ABD1W5T2_9LAMI